MVYCNSDLVRMEPEEYIKMYENLHPEVRKEFDIYLSKLSSISTREYLEHLKYLKNRPSKIGPSLALQLAY